MRASFAVAQVKNMQNESRILHAIMRDHEQFARKFVKIKRDFNQNCGVVRLYSDEQIKMSTLLGSATFFGHCDRVFRQVYFSKWMSFF